MKDMNVTKGKTVARVKRLVPIALVTTTSKYRWLRVSATVKEKRRSSL